MKITVKLFATLRDGRFDVKEMEFPEKATPRTVAEYLGIADEDAAIVFVNGRNAEPDQMLGEGNTVAIFPPIGGG